MLDQILTTALSNGLPLEINFSAGRGQEEDAVILVAGEDWLLSHPAIDPDWMEED